MRPRDVNCFPLLYTQARPISFWSHSASGPSTRFTKAPLKYTPSSSTRLRTLGQSRSVSHRQLGSHHCPVVLLSGRHCTAGSAERGTAADVRERAQLDGAVQSAATQSPRPGARNHHRARLWEVFYGTRLVARRCSPMTSFLHSFASFGALAHVRPRCPSNLLQTVDNFSAEKRTTPRSSGWLGRSIVLQTKCSAPCQNYFF